jgi:uncharacterized membrane protein YgdD (TMEM256/DUF423 family)
MLRIYAFLAAVSGFLSVAIGAFAAHGISDPRAHELIDTGARYQLVHALAALVALTLWRSTARARHAPALFLAGSVLFSGSLYALAFDAPRWVGPITPLGGLLFLGGWAVLAWAALALRED